MAVQGEFHQVASDTKSPCSLNQGHKYPPADGGIQNSQRDTGNQLLTTRIRFRLQKKNTQVPVNTKAIFIEPKLYRSTLLFFTSFPIIIINKRQKKYRKSKWCQDCPRKSWTIIIPHWKRHSPESKNNSFQTTWRPNYMRRKPPKSDESSRLDNSVRNWTVESEI